MQNLSGHDFKHITSNNAAYAEALRRLNVSTLTLVHAGMLPVLDALEQAVTPTNSVIARLEGARKVTQWLDRRFAHAPEIGRVVGTDETTVLRPAIHTLAQRMQNTVVEVLHTELYPLLRLHGIQIVGLDSLSDLQREQLYGYFQARVYPLLTPLAVDPGHPFPFISTNSLNLLVEVRRPMVSLAHESTRAFARVKLPRVCPLLLAVPPPGQTMQNGLGPESGRGSPNIQQLVLLSALVKHHINELFTGIAIENAYLFRLLRAAEPDSGMNNSLHAPRGRNRPVARLDVEDGMPTAVLEWLLKHLQVDPMRVLQYAHLASPVTLPEVIEHMVSPPHAFTTANVQYRDSDKRTSVAA